nr:hypothetical protein Iba_chr15aCG7660 [Ipomoea batatas]
MSLLSLHNCISTITGLVQFLLYHGSTFVTCLSHTVHLNCSCLSSSNTKSMSLDALPAMNLSCGACTSTSLPITSTLILSSNFSGSLSSENGLSRNIVLGKLICLYSRTSVDSLNFIISSLSHVL